MARPTVLVTGGTRGIGEAICAALAEDHDLIIGGTDPAAVDAACERYPSARSFAADLTDADAVERAVRELGLERLDGLVHSAGLLGSGAFRDLTRDDWRRTFEVNVFAVADLTRLLLPALRERGVPLPLPDAVPVVDRLAVPDDDKPSGHDDAGTEARSISGQSFQRRSSA